MSDDGDSDALAAAASSTPFAGKVQQLALELEKRLEGQELRCVLAALCILVVGALEEAGAVDELAPGLAEFSSRASALSASILIRDLVGDAERKH